jgi:hypothetical protein
VNVGVANAASLGLHQDLARAGQWNVPFLLCEGFAKVLDNGDVHFTGHVWLLLSSSAICL